MTLHQRRVLIRLRRHAGTDIAVTLMVLLALVVIYLVAAAMRTHA
jgi:hypothetical protein